MNVDRALEVYDARWERCLEIRQHVSNDHG